MTLLLAILVCTPCVAQIHAPDAYGNDSAVIYVVRRGWHIDIGFATPALDAPLKSLAAEFADVHYVFFGFGDEHYLKSMHHNAPSLLAAMWPGPGLILTTGLSVTPQQAFGDSHVIALTVSTRQLNDAELFVLRSLQERDSNEPYATIAGPYAGSLYLAATPTYSALHTCNTWASEALATAGLPVNSTGVVFAGQLWRQVKRLKH